MRRVLVMVAMIVTMFCGYGQCAELVQLNDDIGMLTIVQRYNEAIGADNWEYQVSTYFSECNDTIVPYTTTYQSVNLSHAKFYCSVNGAGLVVCYAVFAPKYGTSSYMIERIATAMLYSIAPLAYDDVKDTIKRFSGGETMQVSFIANNRKFVIDRDSYNRDFCYVMIHAESV